MFNRWFEAKCFRAIHSRNLVYNTCWEDPRLDRQALRLHSNDRVVMITSAGCNALDYALDGPKSIDCVDMNPLQNALLELKMAGIRELDYEDFFAAFGTGWHPDWNHLYDSRLRPQLTPQVRESWDSRRYFFDGSARRGTFYFHGTSGLFAWWINHYLDRVGLREAVRDLVAAPDVETQRAIFAEQRVEKRLWRMPIRWALRRDTTMAMLGVPRSQRLQIDRTYTGGIESFVRDRVQAVLTNLALADNYFWRVYLTGAYSQDCCPEYLKRDNFELLKGGLVDRVHCHTQTMEGFLTEQEKSFDRFVLLDHMDWMAERAPEALAQEWQAIVDHAGSDARILWRSAGPEVGFVNPIEVRHGGGIHRLGDLLSYRFDLAQRLHQLDRVNTYGSFHIADLETAA
ncbi:DUF3419 family protein [Neorhodopirellula lusitana]|uniref:DUF3419 family protein n=1 Tax=Neorhodopirellula lusitana TaxID=445327 RepID=UPI00384ED581